MGDYCLVIAFLELKNQLYRNLEFAFFYYAHGESEMLLGWLLMIPEQAIKRKKASVLLHFLNELNLNCCLNVAYYI